MTYVLRDKNGIKMIKDGVPVRASTQTKNIKIEQLDDVNKSFIATASTEDEDRDKDIIRQNGWQLKNYKNNPVVPWSHNYYEPPKAKSLKTWITNKKKGSPKLMFKPQFDMSDMKSIELFNKYKNGFLSTFSVGFKGIDFNWRDEDNRWYGGMEFIKQELLEISLVTVPANPYANVNNLNLNDGQKSFTQLGYTSYFAKTKEGLFYPVKDIELYVNPEEIKIMEGVKGIKGSIFNDESKERDIVAYMFDPYYFDDKSANEWIEKNVPLKQTVKYYEIKNINDDGIGIELGSLVEVEEDLKLFESSVDINEKDIENELEEDESDLEEKKELEDKSEEDELDLEDESDLEEKNELEEDESDLEEKKELDLDEENESEEDELDLDEENKSDLEENKSDLEEDKLKDSWYTIDKSITITDSNGNVIAKNITSEKMKGVNSYDTLNKITNESMKKNMSNIIEKVIKESTINVTELIVDILTKKLVAKQQEIDDNIDTDDDFSLINGSNDSKNSDNFIELDDSILNTLGDMEEKNDDNIIEIDDETIGNVKIDVNDDEIKQNVMTIFKQKINQAFDEVKGSII